MHRNWRSPERGGKRKLYKLAAGQGLEPQFSRPERDVLPLDDPAMRQIYQESKKMSSKLPQRREENRTVGFHDIRIAVGFHFIVVRRV